MPGNSKMEYGLIDFKTNRVKQSKNAITRCPHKDRAYYALGMCNNCYHNHGRTKYATNCPHPNRMRYAKKMCKSCYVKNNKL